MQFTRSVMVSKFLNAPEAQGPWLSIRDRKTSKAVVRIRSI